MTFKTPDILMSFETPSQNLNKLLDKYVCFFQRKKKILIKLEFLLEFLAASQSLVLSQTPVEE
jgi:hypothetical protein